MTQRKRLVWQFPKACKVSPLMKFLQLLFMACLSLQTSLNSSGETKSERFRIKSSPSFSNGDVGGIVNTDDSSLGFKNYVIKLNATLSEQEMEEHCNTILNVANGKMGYSLKEMAIAIGVPAEIASKLDDISPKVVEESLKQAKGLLGRFDIPGFKGYHGVFPDWMIRVLQSVPHVEIVEPDITVSATDSFSKFFGEEISITTQYDIQNWGLDRISHKSEGFQRSYDYPTVAGEGVDIYILDSGVFANHIDFLDGETNQSRVSFGASFTSDGEDDQHGHGTHVAGIAAGNTLGVAKKANIIAVKVLNNEGLALSSVVISGIEWAVKNQKKTGRRSVMNLSIGGKEASIALRDAVDAAFAQGFVISVAAGNLGKDACTTSPQDAKGGFKVAATDENNNRYTSSNYGACVDIFAPGTNITSAAPNGQRATRKLTGTSQAAPFVAGQMAILLSVFPDMTQDNVYSTLKNSAIKNVVKGVTEKDPNLLLYNSVNTPELGANGKPLGNSFRLGGGGWILVKQIFFSTFV